MNIETIRAFVKECKDAKMLTDLIAIACDQPAVANLGCERMLPEHEKGNLFIRQMNLSKVGNAIPGEEHNYDHAFIVCAGKVLIREGMKVTVEENFPEEILLKDGTRLDVNPENMKRVEHGEAVYNPAGSRMVKKWHGPVFEKPFGPGTFKTIYADMHHEAVSMEPGTIGICVFGHRNKDGEITERGCGFDKPYK